MCVPDVLKVPALTPAPSEPKPAGIDRAELLSLVEDGLQAVQHYIVGIAPPQSLPLARSTGFARQVSGKLIRPGLTLMIARAMGLPDSDALIKTASVSELIHVATLLHDDVLDDSDQRRGQPTVSALYGNKVAILSGDWMLAQASRTLAEVGNLPLVRLFSEVLADLCDGEVEQMRTAFDLDATTWDTYQRKTYGKTASLFAAATQAPALLAGSSPEEVAGWRQFGLHLGMAFQWMDDLLDYTGEAERMGKPVLDDLKNGLPNAPILLALAPGSALTPEDRTTLAGQIAQVFAWAQRPESSATEQADLDGLCLAIRDRLATGGILQAVRERAEAEISQALKHIPAQARQTPAGHGLSDLARFVLLRNT